MNNNSWFKKEMPLQTVIGFGGGATGFGAHSSSATKIYVDDVFSTYLYEGTGSTRSISNSIDLSTKGGMTWIKNRGTTDNHNLFDTERGATKYLRSNENTTETTDANGLSAFNSDGFSVVSDTTTNASSNTYSSWTFRKQKGFFDVVSYTGDGTAGRTISHSLGSIPGSIIIKCRSHGLSWVVGHREFNSGNNPWNKFLKLSNQDAESDDNEIFNDTPPTSTNFTVGDSNLTNDSGKTYVAYVFAGGASTAATAPSVDFDGSSYLDIADHSDFTFGTDDFTIECWYKADDLNLSSNWDYIFSSGWPVQLGHTVDSANTNSRFSFYMSDGNTSSGSYFVSNLNTGNGSVYAGQWYHVAVTRSGSTFRIFLNGELKDTATSSGSAPAPNINSAIGRFNPGSGGNYFYADGKISNFRYVKGTAVYTESFRPPTEPLTNITNTKLLCCNNSSVTGSTVTPGTITNNGSTASTVSPFDDPNGFKFGGDSDNLEGIIKVGSYIGNMAMDGPEVYVGFEPQWLMIRGEGGGDWNMVDTMRGIVTEGNDHRLWANSTSGDSTSMDAVDITPTGFKIKMDGAAFNSTGTMLYIAIRRPDGYVGKPPSAGTDVFGLATGRTDSVKPTFTTGFPVDFNMYRPITTSSWVTSGRLIGKSILYTDSNGSQQATSAYEWNWNTGMGNWTGDQSAYLSWLWKRGAGFDVVTYTGDDAAFKVLPHSLGQTPEMIWIKCRDDTAQWVVGHKGRNGGVNPWNYFSALDGNGADEDNTMFNDTAPTSTHFTIGTDNDVNDTDDYIVMLFASANDADGNPISKVGSYSGSGSTGNAQNIGFQPRLLIIKRTNSTGDWFIFDSQRGFGKYMQLNTTQQEYTQTYVNVSATGFSLVSDYGDTNESGSSYIYYAHA